MDKNITHIFALILFLMTNFSSGMETTKSSTGKNSNLCVFCNTIYSSCDNYYGCPDCRHALCLYTLLEINAIVSQLLDLITLEPQTDFTYACPTCFKECSLNKATKYLLYQDCITNITNGNSTLQQAYLLALPQYLARKIVKNMSESARSTYFRQLPTHNDRWKFLIKLPLAEWNFYIELLNENERDEFDRAKPIQVFFIQEPPTQRISYFKNATIATKKSFMMTFYEEFSSVEFEHYLTTFCEEIKENEHDIVDECSTLFTAIIANNNLTPTETVSLFKNIIDYNGSLITIDDFPKFFTLQITLDSTYLCIKQIVPNFTQTEMLLLLKMIWQNLKSEQQLELFDIIYNKALNTTDDSPDYALLASLLIRLSPDILYKKTTELVDQITNTEDGALFLATLWDGLKSSHRCILAKKVLSKNILTAPSNNLNNTIFLLKKLPHTLAYKQTKIISHTIKNNNNAMYLFKEMCGLFGTEKRYRIFIALLKNSYLHNPSITKLKELFYSFPSDLAYHCTQKALKKITSQKNKTTFLCKMAPRFSSPQHIILLKNILKKKNLSDLQTCTLIEYYATLLTKNHRKRNTYYDDFFNTIHTDFDKLFLFCTKHLPNQFFINVWPILPTEFQPLYFAHLPPKNRDALALHFFKEKEVIKKLLDYKKNLDSWWSKRSKEEILTYWDAVPDEIRRKYFLEKYEPRTL